MTSESVPPPPSHILETCLYVRSMEASTKFYRDILRLTPKICSPRLTMFPLGNTTLILFQLGMTEEDNIMDNGIIPGHGPDKDITLALTGGANAGGITQALHTHYCLAVASPEEVDLWRKYLDDNNVKVGGTMNWEKGGKSVYFEDPDGHVGEIGSKGIWEHW